MLERTGALRILDDDRVARVPTVSTRVHRVEVHAAMAPAREAWEELEAVAAISPYQTWRWVTPWLETTGRSTAVTPFIVVAYDEDDAPLALLPFGTWRRGLLTLAGFLGGRDSNFNLGLFRPGSVWSAEAVMGLLRSAARARRGGVDLFVLRNQPHEWEGAANPLKLLPHQDSPSFGYKVALLRDGGEFGRRNLSGDRRKKLRQKLSRLEAIAAVRHEMAGSSAARDVILDAFTQQRLARCAALGLAASDLPDLRAFLHRSSTGGTEPAPVELHALYCGDRVLATFAGTAHRDRFCGMVMSFDAGPDFARFSPGEILLERLIRAKCDEGFAVFDLGVGEARYKDAYCPEPEPLFDTLVTVSRHGRIVAAAETMRLRLKRKIKQSRLAWAAVRFCRKLVAYARRGGRPVDPGAARSSPTDAS